MAFIQWLDEDIPSRKRAKVNYEVKSLDGKRKRQSKTFKPGTPIKAINAFKRKVEDEYENGVAKDYSKRTVGEFVKEYFALYGQHLSPSTERNYRQMAYAKENGIITYFGHIELKKLDAGMVQKYVNELSNKGLNPKTIKNYTMFLHTLYERAIRLQYVSQEVNIVSRVDMPKVRKKPVDSYSAEEVKTLLALADKYANDRLRLQIYLAVGSGCRRSELAAIKIESIDFEKKVLHITESKISLGGTNEDVVKAPKTDSAVRDIPLSDGLVKELKKAVDRYNKNKLLHGAEFEDSRFIFSNEYGHPYKTDTMTGAWREFMKKYGGEGELRYLPLHTAGRHTYASLGVTSGRDIKTMQEVLGHADASTTLNTYARSYWDKKQEFANILDETIFSKEA